MQLKSIKIKKPDDTNFILGQTHFIKSVEDIHEALVTAVPGIKFGLAFCEASGKCLVRWSGTDEAMIDLAMNGAEVVYRASMPAPFTENDIFEISNRARALENNMYIVAPNIGSYHLDVDHPVGIDAGGGQSMIVDYRGQLVGKQRDTNGSTFVAGVINIEALRHHRESAQVTNWMKDVRAELAQIIYEKPIYPKNRYLKKVPPKHAEYKRDVIDKQIALMHKRGIWKKSSKK